MILLYNRYIPQPDGSFRRNRMQENLNSQHNRSIPKNNGPFIPVTDDHSSENTEATQTPSPSPSRHDGSIRSFFRQLFPKGLDTGDLLIILLLLLMAGDNTEDQNTAMLTLALYLFM